MKFGPFLHNVSIVTVIVVSGLFVLVLFFNIKTTDAEQPAAVFTVMNSSDDARARATSGRGDSTTATHYLGTLDGEAFVHGLRFADVNLPAGVRVTSAHLELYSAGLTESGDVILQFYGEAAADSGTFRTANSLPTDRTLTDKLVTYTPDQADWQRQGFGTNIDVTKVVQAIVAGGEWESGSAVTLIQTVADDSTGYVTYSTFDRDMARAPRLVIEYEPSIVATVVEKIKSVQDTIKVYKLERQVRLSNNNETATLMAWLYPGEPACNAVSELEAASSITVAKPEYFTLSAAGELTLLTEETAGCNGYSTENVATIKAASEDVFVTVSASGEHMTTFFERDWTEQHAAIKTLVDFAVSEDVTGIEIDFEGFGNWTEDTYRTYLGFLNELGKALHAADKELMVDVPPIGTALEQSYYHLRYEDIADLPIDYIVVMAYDYQYDYGVGTAIAPNEWVLRIITEAQKHIEADRLVIGLPAYGYYGEKGSYRMTVTSSEQAQAAAGDATFTRDPESYELIATERGQVYVYQDAAALDKKRRLIESQGVKYISVWALGGTAWFSES